MDETIRIAMLENGTEAEQLAAALTRANIPHQIEPMQNQSGAKSWGCVQAPASCQKKILFFLSNIRQDARRC